MMFLIWGSALSARNVLLLVRLGFFLLSFWLGMILKLLLLGVLIVCLVALDAVECGGLHFVFRESWGVLLASPLRFAGCVAGLGCFR